MFIFLMHRALEICQGYCEMCVCVCHGPFWPGWPM